MPDVAVPAGAPRPAVVLVGTARTTATVNARRRPSVLLTGSRSGVFTSGYDGGLYDTELYT